jgi:CRP-like cAMP-binding protein
MRKTTCAFDTHRRVRKELQSRLLAGLAPPSVDRAAEVLARAATVEIEPGKPYFPASFPTAVLLVVEEGFVVVRATLPGMSRSVITCEAGAGRILVPPTSEEALFALGSSRLTAISAEALDRLLSIPAVAQSVVWQMTSTLGQKQEAIANFAPTRHLERVRRKLLQLGRSYGHVVRDGIRIDFPVSHALLAEMIGSSRETVTRALDELRSLGFVARSGSTYRLLVPAEAVFGRDLRHRE